MEKSKSLDNVIKELQELLKEDFVAVGMGTSLPTKEKNGASTCQRELSDVVPKDGRISTCIEIKTADLSTQAVVAGRWWQSWTMVRSGYSHLSLLLLNT